MADPVLSDQIVQLLSSANQSLAGAILNYAISLAGVGTIVMAILEGIKAIIPIRSYFHRWRTANWIGDQGRGWSEFIALSTGGYASQSALFDQSTDKLMAQVQAAANMAMDFPDRYPDFYEFLTQQPEARHREDASRWRSHVERTLALQAVEKGPSAEDREAGRARARLQNLMSRQLDAFQTETQYKWAKLNQVVATALGSGFIFYALLPIQDRLAIPLLGIACIALVGGMSAPVAKDLVSALSNFRK